MNADTFSGFLHTELPQEAAGGIGAGGADLAGEAGDQFGDGGGLGMPVLRAISWACTQGLSREPTKLNARMA